MALNAASHNPSMFALCRQNEDLTKSTASEPTGSVSGPAPKLSDDIVKSVSESAGQDSTGQNAAGQDKHANDAGQTVMGDAGKEKTAKESKKDPDGPN